MGLCDGLIARAPGPRRSRETCDLDPQHRHPTAATASPSPALPRPPASTSTRPRRLPRSQHPRRRRSSLPRFPNETSRDPPLLHVNQPLPPRSLAEQASVEVPPDASASTQEGSVSTPGGSRRTRIRFRCGAFRQQSSASRGPTKSGRVPGRTHHCSARRWRCERWRWQANAGETTVASDLGSAHGPVVPCFATRGRRASEVRLGRHTPRQAAPVPTGQGDRISRRTTACTGPGRP